MGGGWGYCLGRIFKTQEKSMDSLQLYSPTPPLSHYFNTPYVSFCVFLCPAIYSIACISIETSASRAGILGLRSRWIIGWFGFHANVRRCEVLSSVHLQLKVHWD